MGLFSWIVIGLLAGWLASKVVKGHGSGLIGNLIVGVIGALLGGWISGTFLGISLTGFNLTTFLIAFAGAVLLLLLLRLFRRR